MKKEILILLFISIAFGIKAQENTKLETVIQRGHLKYVSCSAFSPDGKYCVTGSVDNSVKLWNTQTGKEIRSFNDHTEMIYSTQFSPDGKYVLTSAADNMSILYEVLTGKVIHQFKVKNNSLRKAIFSPNGTKVLTQDNRDQTLVWDVVTGKKIGEYKKDFAGSIHSQWFSPEDDQLLSYDNYKTAIVKSLSEEVDSLVIPFDKAHSFSFSKNGKYIAIGSKKLFTEVFDAKTGKLLQHLKIDENIRCDGCNTKIVFSNDSKFLLTGSDREDITIWNVATGKKVRQLANSKEKDDQIVMSPNDKYVALKNDDSLHIYNFSTGRKIFTVASEYLEYYAIHFSPNSKYILLPGKYNTCEMWNVVTGKKVQTFKGYLNQKNTDGLSYTYTNWTHQNILRYLSMKNTIAISPDGKYVVKGKVDSVSQLINIKTGRIEKTFVGHHKTVYTFDFSPDGKQLLTAGGDGDIKLWDVTTGEEIKTFKGHNDLIFDVKFSSDGKQVVSGSWDGFMRIWDVQSGGLLKYIKLNENSPYVVGFSPNDLYVVSGDLEKKISFWEADAGEEFRSIVGHTGLISSFDFTTDGKKMVSGSWDGKVKVWDVLTGMLLAKFNHGAGVNTVAVDPKSRFVVSAGKDRLIKLWSTETGKLLQTLEGHLNAVSSVKITADGKKMVSCSVDGIIKVWDLASYKEVYTYMQIGREDWLVKIPQGNFDGSAKALKYINYVSGMESVPVGNLFKIYNTPGLLKQLNEGNTFGNVNDINGILKSSPEVIMELVDGNGTVYDIRQDSTLELKPDRVKAKVSVISNGVALEEVRVYNNGKLIQYESVKGKAKKTVKYFDIELINGRNKISAVVLNENLVESEPSTEEIVHYGEGALSNLYVLSIGINDYKNTNYHLNYALNDAKSYSKLITKGSSSLFNKIEEHFISNEDANKTSILKEMKEIGAKAGPHDVFLFYYAGHGVIGGNGSGGEDFYVVTYDVTNIYGKVDELKEKAISASELMKYSMNIKAEKQLFVLDACHSGGALNAFTTRGIAREKAISQLARSTGTVFLTASQEAQYANEESKLKHGLFTYALIEGLQGNADSGIKDKKITVNELKSYVEDRVPELSEQYGVPAQYPTGYSYGQDFPIVIIK